MAPRTQQLNSQPWRFRADNFVWVRNWSQDYPVRIIEPLFGLIFPHYLVADYKGDTWRISQLELSANPLLKREVGR